MLSLEIWTGKIQKEVHKLQHTSIDGKSDGSFSREYTKTSDVRWYSNNLSGRQWLVSDCCIHDFLQKVMTIEQTLHTVQYQQQVFDGSFLATENDFIWEKSATLL